MTTSFEALSYASVLSPSEARTPMNTPTLRHIHGDPRPKRHINITDST